MHRFRVALLASVLVGAVAAFAAPSFAARPEPGPPADRARADAAWQLHRELEAGSPFHGLEWRDIGPVVQGGRLVDIEVDPRAPYTFYVAYASGGLWKTSNNGMSFEPLFDDQRTIIMGDIALDPQNPDTIWVGSGENNSSRSSYGGAGMFRSTDGGETWEHRGLYETDRIGRVLVDPADSNVVLVAALGRLYTETGERGIFRTADAGNTWTRVLDGDGYTGFIDMVRHPTNPDVVYASSWDRSRRPHDFVEGGEGSGIWKSTDRGLTWTRLDGGFPRGEHVGRIGLAVTPASPDSLYAYLDNQELLPEELWDLGGAAVSPKRMRGMSKEEFLAQDDEEVEDFLRNYDLDHELTAKKLKKKIEDDELKIEDLLDKIRDGNASLFETDVRGAEVWRSDDGGATFDRTHDDPIRALVHTYGYYFGQIRVAPDDPDRIYILGVPLLTSGDGGKTWKNINAPNVHVDHQSMWIDPDAPQHLVLGNDGGFYQSWDGGESWLELNKISVAQIYAVGIDDAEPYNVYVGLQDNGVLKGSSTSRSGRGAPWEVVGGGDGMYTQVDPRDGTFYWGFQFGNYFRVEPSGKRSRVKPWTKLDEAPLRWNWQTPIQLSPHHSDILYMGSNKLFRSLDRGDTFEAISDDLTRSAARGDVPFATLSVLAESVKSFGLIWAGTDDGYVWVTEDGGKTWRDASDGLPKHRWVSRVEPSHHEKNRAYVSLNGYRDDDPSIYLYVTDDLGRSWRSIGAGIPEEVVNVVREDPVNEDVLYVGTDRGVYVSTDRGDSWTALSSGLPNAPVHDLKVHPTQRELVAGTHGRSAWVVDVLPVQEYTDDLREKALEVFPVESMKWSGRFKSRRSPWWFDPEDAPKLTIPFWTRDGGDATFTVEDPDGRVLYSRAIATTAGIDALEWDLLLDETLALEAERARLAAQDDDGGETKKKKKRKKSDEATEKKRTRADTPWAEAVRLERPLYVSPGKYTLKIRRGEDSASTEFEMKPPTPRPPRIEKETPIRGRKSDDDEK